MKKIFGPKRLLASIGFKLTMFAVIKIRNQRPKWIDVVLLQDSRAHGPIGDQDAKCVDVLVVDCLNRIFMEIARQKTSCAFLNVLLVSGCQF